MGCPVCLPITACGCATNDGVEMRELSMGMSGDYDLAAAHGATLVRIGSAPLAPAETKEAWEEIRCLEGFD